MDKINEVKDAWDKLDEMQIERIREINQEYINFLDLAKTEREAVSYIVETATNQGFVDLEEVDTLETGQRLIYKLKDKICALIVLGGKALEEGVNIVASHIDSPRIDLKAEPLYEADGQALFKTHYYGGIKKYQWVTIPLALHGVVFKKDGERINIRIGENEDDFVLTISDLLPHLAKDQMEKKVSEAIKGEDLNVLIGNYPLKDVNNNPVKENIMKILKEKYNIEIEDFASAELQLVPAFKAKEVGFDRSMIGGYGQDDRVCAYTSLRAALEVDKPEHTAICLFVDKEEIGSTGNTGLQSLLIENLIAELYSKMGEKDYFKVRKCLANSCALSADVNAAVDPNYPEVFDKLNCSYMSRGVVLTKYTGSRGKSGSNDANPEFLAKIRSLFAEHEVIWQVGELGKVDIGGGGTVAQYMSWYGMEVVDLGVAVLSMHSPFEVTSKVDNYMAYRAYLAFMQSFLI
ncbi:MAG TPA: aminopeptidase [Syntrophomonadaceae bacterium]|nr:aminopeptidase [Syntrophomonadaceae bacterium]